MQLSPIHGQLPDRGHHRYAQDDLERGVSNVLPPGAEPSRTGLHEGPPIGTQILGKDAWVLTVSTCSAGTLPPPVQRNACRGKAHLGRAVLTGTAREKTVGRYSATRGRLDDRLGRQ